jgi:pimeloyl-ACP methyl ester carboxylesterase
VGTTVELQVDVTEAAALGMPAEIAVSAILPDPDQLLSSPIVCFGFPGGGYSRRYFTTDLVGGDPGGEAQWHVNRGWIFVAIDHLGFGDSTTPEGNELNYDNVAAGNKVAVETVLAKLADGTLLEGYPTVTEPTTLGIGQSMGGCFTIVLQGQHQVFDGIGALGYSAIHTVVPSKPGGPQAVWPWMLRGSNLETDVPLNLAAVMAAAGPAMGDPETMEQMGQDGAEHPFQWAFHYDDEPASIVARDMKGAAGDLEDLAPWRSASTPTCGIFMVAPGTVATEAASITVPVFVGVGERDVVPNPWMEPFAYKSATDISLFVCPTMAHMHNFASTRHLFWERLHSWGTGVAAQKAVK